MTARECWEGLLTELSKVNAPSMLLSDFNYFFNKALLQFVNKRYNYYDVNQESSDGLRVLKSSSILNVEKTTNYGSSIDLSKYTAGESNLFGATYECNLPLDYVHLLNCICVFKVKERFKCWNEGDYVKFPAKRLTADAWSVICIDYYNRPLPWRPYFYIHNVNISNDLPTNKIDTTDILSRTSKGTDANSNYSSEKSNLPRKINLAGITNNSTVEREAGQRYGNSSPIRMEIRYGEDDTVFTLEKVIIDYIKAPQTIRLTQEQVNLTKDTSQIMEFPDYVCQEIINELVMLVMENTADPRLSTNLQVSKSIATPAQQQTPQPQVQQAQQAE